MLSGHLNSEQISISTGNSPLLSICIPTFNRAKALLRLLTVLAPQCEGKNIEIVISDNGSVDDTNRICNRFLGKYDFIRFRRSKKNLGFATNLLSVLRFAKGEYLWMLGDDDLIGSNAVLEIISTLNAESPSLLVCNFSRLRSESDDWQSCREYHLSRNINGLSLDELLRICGIWGSFMSINIIHAKLFNEWENSVNRLTLSGNNYIGFDICLYVGSKGNCSMIAEPIVGREKRKLSENQFSNINIYAFQFFAPIDYWVSKAIISQKTRNQLASQIFIGMVGFLLFKCRIHSRNMPRIGQWVKVHGWSPCFWVIIFPV
ncbi:MAG TPA: glycosyltransferase family 2 protein, partial [Spirochaetes bacterium]|nr:glycosyltransferase family 2 protein [Spirochaetota bacterium]